MCTMKALGDCQLSRAADQHPCSPAAAVATASTRQCPLQPLLLLQGDNDKLLLHKVSGLKTGKSVLYSVVFAMKRFSTRNYMQCRLLYPTPHIIRASFFSFNLRWERDAAAAVGTTKTQARPKANITHEKSGIFADELLHHCLHLSLTSYTSLKAAFELIVTSWIANCNE